MCMAMETDNYNKEAQKALEELPETAMTKYMKLVIYIRERNCMNGATITPSTLTKPARSWKKSSNWMRNTTK